MALDDEAAVPAYEIHAYFGLLGRERALPHEEGQYCAPLLRLPCTIRVVIGACVRTIVVGVAAGAVVVIVRGITIASIVIVIVAVVIAAITATAAVVFVRSGTAAARVIV